VKSGRMIGTPFLPPVTPGMQVPWRPLVKVTESIFAAAHSSVQDVDTAMPSMIYFLSAENDKSVSKVAQLQFDQSIISNIITDRNNVFGVQSDGKADSLFQVAVGNQPSIAASQPMTQRYVAGPWLAGDSILLQLDDDSLTCFDTSLQQKWSLPIGNVQIASIPSDTSSGLMVVFSNGRLLKLNAGQGTIEKQLELGQPIIGSPNFIGNNVVFRGSDGTIHLINAAELN